MFIIRHRNIFFALTGLLVLASLISLAVFGLKLGADFTGGTLVQVSYDGTRPDAVPLTNTLNDAGFKGYSLRESGDNGYILRTQSLTDAERGMLSAVFSYQGGTARIDQLTEVGPIIGVELRNKAIIALTLVLLCILFFIAFAFRKVSEPVSSWRYGLIALLTLCFDVIVPVGFFAFLGYAVGVQVDTLFVTAVLTILGYSVHDTIVVFDRTRENLRINHEHNKKEDFAETAGRALSQTLVRSTNTSLTTALVLSVLCVLGPESTRYFALTLLVGIIAGTYSSIFLATPLLVTVERWRRTRKK
jgi:preprotein translocase subunit SecF